MAFTHVEFVGDGTPPSTQSAASSIAAATDDDSGYHQLVIHGYSRTKKSTPYGKCIRSPRFRAGGYRWLIEFYPNGSLSEEPDSTAFYLYLDEEDHVEVEVQCSFSFVNQVAGSYIFCPKRSRYFSSHASSWGCIYVEKGHEFERYRSDSFVVRCDVEVTKAAHNNGGAAVPPPDLRRHLDGLLLSGEGADVTFEVKGETFAAHRCVLAARSSVFKAELFGPMVEGTTSNAIRVDDIEAQVFKLLLTFIYSDSVPEPDEIGEEDEQVAIWSHCLAAADRYDLPRLRLMCEVNLCRYMDAATVAPMVVLAERHYCRGLKEACLDFICYPTNLQELMVAGVLDHLLSSCPSVLKEIVVKLASLKLDVNIVGDSGDLPFLAVPESDLHQHLSWLLQSEEGTDVTFAVGAETLSAHRCVLAARSAVFRAQLFGQIEEDSSSTTGVIIRIDDMEAKTFRLLLTFIYSDSVPNIKEGGTEQLEQNEDDDADVTWQHLLIAAGRYGLQRLRMICEVNLCKYINATTVAVILVLAEQHNCGCLKEACLDFLYIPANLQEAMAAGSLDHLSKNCPSVLIDVIVKLASLKCDN